MIIKISQDEIQKCGDFAEQQYETSKKTYARRSQTNKGVVIKQIQEGKMAEIGAYRFLIEKGLTVCVPDFNIYKGKQKSYGSDIIGERWKFCVKAQSKESADQYGTSWVFSATINSIDPIICNPEDNEVMLLTLVDNDIVEVLGMIKAKDAKPFYREPQLPHLKHHKVCLYFDDIKECLLHDIY